jgi:hypothetical protein
MMHSTPDHDGGAGADTDQHKHHSRANSRISPLEAVRRGNAMTRGAGGGTGEAAARPGRFATARWVPRPKLVRP